MKYIRYLSDSYINKIKNSIFSASGVYSQQQILFVLSFVYIIKTAVVSLNIHIVTLTIILFLFYMSVLAVQKRCRDFGYEGTFGIICYTLFFILSSITDYNSFIINDETGVYLGYIESILGIVILIICIIPSKKEKDLTLCSPLLKHPYIYVGICYIFYLIGFYYLIHFQ